ncbi:MAG: DEAD/DEAH box helicase, partial [Pseudobdellovibrionaceae bacterium]
MSRLKTHLASVDHGTLSDLIGDAKIVELVNEISRSRDAKVERGDLILQVVGGPQALLESAQKRKVLFLSLNKTDRTTLMNALGISSLNSFKLTSERKPIIYEYFGCALPPERSEQEVGLPRVEILSPEYSLFAHQNSALQRSKSFFHSSLPRVMLHMPTGSGKTRTAMHLISNILNSREAGVVVWLVAGKELCQQASEEFERAWRSLGGRELPIVRLWSEVGDPSIPAHMIQQFANDKWPETLTDAMIIGSVDSVRNIVMSWEPSQRIGRRKNICLVVFDEAHRSVAKTYSETINSITDKSTALLGLSATPGRRHYGG